MITRLLLALAVVVSLLAWGGLALADGGSEEHPADPKDARCVERGQVLASKVRAANAPYYEYQFPVLLSDDGVGERTAWLGWAFADACTMDPERKGGTWANLLVTPSADYSELWTYDTKPLRVALPDAAPDPTLGTIRVIVPGNRVPVGVDRHTAAVMDQNGFSSARDVSGSRRILLDTSRETAVAVIAWWDVHGQGPFYAREPEGWAADHLDKDGGIARVWIRPVNLRLQTPSLLSQASDTVRVQVDALYDTKRTKALTAAIGYRWASEGDDVDWHLLPSATLQPGPHNWLGLAVPRSPLGPAGAGDTLHLKINPSEDQPDDETSYADNVVSLPVPASTDLTLTLSAPGHIPAPVPPDLPTFTVTAWVTSTQQDVDTVVRLTVTRGRGGTSTVEKTVHLTGGAAARPVEFTVAGSSPNDTISVAATVNPDKTVPESDYSNNQATAVVLVDPVDQSGGDDAGHTGGVINQ